ncbi:DUF333 domain-containing protein [Candidatus Pacearchaeota archaeon]|nr:DUF333 domain-containing protein [Candidatus Pacearchaeota archaeon]
MNDGYKSVNMVKPDGVWINQKCADSKSDCPLYLTLPKAKEYRGKLAGNEAARYCHQVNGNSVILKDKNGGYYDFCHFENGDYLIDSWILVLKGR